MGADAAEILLWLASPGAIAAFRSDRLSPTDQARHERIRGQKRRTDFEVSRALLQGLDLEATVSPMLSHSGGHAAIAQLEPSGLPLAIGIDLERRARRDDQSLARFAFSEEEFANLAELRDDERQRRFYTLWTLKEATAKLLGAPLTDALRQCVFVQRDGSWDARIPTSAPYSAFVFEPRPDLSLAVAILGSASLPTIRLLEWPSRAEVRWPVVAQVSRDSRGGRGGLYPPEGAGAGARAPRATGP